jgi:hypothetical protein
MNIHALRLMHENAWRQSYPYFINLINRFSLRVGAEVGVAFGGHAEAILDNTSVARLVGVDPYQHLPNYDDMLNLSQEQFENMFWYTIGRLSRFGERYMHVRAPSHEAVRNIDGLADFVYIDANHNYDAVKQDLALWMPKIRAGGIIGGHDFSPEFPGVRQAVQELADQLKIQVTVEPASVWWAQLPAGQGS